MTFRYDSSEASFTAQYLWPMLRKVLLRHAPPPSRVFEIGCGNGATARMLAAIGYDVVGVDPSESGVALAKADVGQSNPTFALASTNDDLAARFGAFPVVVSLEVIEHCVSVAQFASQLRALVEPGGVIVLSTPYHGYLKNLAVVAGGKFDHHFDPLWEGGHLHFFTIAKLREMFLAAGLRPLGFHRVGRVLPILAKSVVAVAHG